MPEGTSPQEARPRLSVALGIQRLEPRGGLEDNCIRVAEELERRGHAVALHVASGDRAAGRATVPLLGSRRPLTNHGMAAAFARAFVDATRGRFDRAMAFQPAPGIELLFCADWLRDTPGVSLWRRLTPRFRTYAALEAGCFSPQAQTRIIGLAQPQMDAYRARYGTPAERIAIVPPTLSPEKRRPERRTSQVRRETRERLGIPQDVPVWLWLGLQPKVKGLDRVVEALSDHADTHLIVGGLAADADKAGEPRAEADRRGVAGRIRWAGYLDVDGLADCCAAADVLAHPARLDVTGGVILEGMANGLPVVATANCGFSPHIEASGAGRVVSAAFDAGEFSRALGDVAAASAALSARALTYVETTDLYSGIAAACDLIEAERWPA